MDSDNSRKIVSRRDRPAKAPLSRDVIVLTALSILEHEGLPGLSLRKVATALDTGPASLYVYVANLENLHALMLDQALGEVKLPRAGSAAWGDRLRNVLLSYLHVLYERPGLAQLAMSIVPTDTNSLRIMECILGLLKEGGIEDGKAAWGMDLLLLYVTAIAAEQSVRRTRDEGLEPVADALSAITEEEFPTVFAMRSALLSGGRARAAWAIDVMINGILHSPLPANKEALAAKKVATRKNKK